MAITKTNSRLFDFVRLRLALIFYYQYLFALYDTDGNGTLTTSEFNAVITKMMQLAKVVGRGGDITQFAQAVKEKFDHNGDGKVSLVLATYNYMGPAYLICFTRTNGLRSGKNLPLS